MEVWSTAIARETTVGPGGTSRIAWRHALFHWRTTLSPAAGAKRSLSPRPRAEAASQPAVARTKREKLIRRENAGLPMLRAVAFIRTFVLLALAATGLSLGCAADRPPIEQGSFHKPELVELIRLDPTIHLDIRYATANNIVHRPVYRQARAFLQRPAAQALVRVNRSLSERPPTGKEVEMPSAYDETSERASPGYAGGTREQREHRDLLRTAMEREGFTVEPNEWWHFNYKDWKQYSILDILFEEIREDSGSPGESDQDT